MVMPLPRMLITCDYFIKLARRLHVLVCLQVSVTSKTFSTINYFVSTLESLTTRRLHDYLLYLPL
jgi:hypothetical protein